MVRNDSGGWTALLDRLRSHIPSSVKRPVRRALDDLEERRRFWALRRHVRTLRAELGRGTLPIRAIAGIREMWGNTGFAAEMDLAIEIANRVVSSRGPFLECGSGFSTILAGIIATHRGSRLIALEQDLRWFNRLKQTLARLSISNVELIYAPLIRYDDFVWFDVQDVALPTSLTHVFCDGPAVGPKWADPMRANWRAYVVPLLQQRGIAFEEILLDDSQDERCDRLRATWRALGVETRVVDAPTRGYVVGVPVPGARREMRDPVRD